MERLRLAVKKDGALQFLSHLDFARAVRYVIVRAHLPINYSEGFNPHMKLSFASALGVGVCADVEYLDMELAEKIPVQEVMERMNAQSPDGFAVLDGHYIDAKAPKLMAMANYAVYDLFGPATAPLDQAGLDAVLRRFNDDADITFEKVSIKGKHKAREIHVKDHVIEPLMGTIKDDRITIRAGIYQTADGAIKPQEVWDILVNSFELPAVADLMLARRRAIYTRKDGENRSLFAIE